MLIIQIILHFLLYIYVFLIVLCSEVGRHGFIFVFLQIGKSSAPQSQRGPDQPQPRPLSCHQQLSKHTSALARFQVSDFIRVNQNFANVKCFVVLTKYDKYSEHSLLCDFFPPPDISDSIIQLICVAKATGLGLLIKGGANRADGPVVFIQELMPGGDCQKVILLSGKGTSEFHNSFFNWHL